MADDGIWKRGGSFNNNRRGTRGRGRSRGRRGGGGHPLDRVEDSDGDSYMNDEVQERPPRYQPYQRDNSSGGSRGRGGRGSVFSRLGTSAGGGGLSQRAAGLRSKGEGWHKVTVFKGASHSKEWLIRTLKESISEPFIPVQTHQLGDKFLFFVEENRAAQELKDLNAIESKEGPLTIVVRPSNPPTRRGEDSGASRGRGGGGGGRGARGGSSGPQFKAPRFSNPGARFASGRRDDDVSMDEDYSDVLKQVLGERFDTQTTALNLQDMFHDQKFRESNIRASMFDAKFVQSILSTIEQHCPDLLILNLSSNRIQRLEAYSSLPTCCKSLQSLDLSNNEIRYLNEFEHIRGMGSVVRLALENNPVAEQAQDLGSFASSLRNYFPNLQVLDNQTLPSPVKFDLPVAIGQLPPYIQNHLPSEDIKVLVIKFLEEFYTLYDGDSRDRLIQAYAEGAVFSMCIALPENQRDHYLQNYLSMSRNLLKVKEPGKRSSLLKRGNIDIIQFFRNLPKTKHLNYLFEVDIIKSTGVETIFVVHGAFNEESDSRELLVRSFTRTFVLEATGSSMRVCNDLLTITSASAKTIKHVQENPQTVLFQSSSSLPPPPPTGSLQQLPAPIQTAIPAAPITMTAQPTLSFSLADAQQDAIRRLAETTKMNFEYCSKCLQENEWNYSAALQVFEVLQANGKIPPQAFL